MGHRQKVASAEILYHNCLFENCGTALAFLTFNDYDNTIDGCEFRDCGTGVLDNKGNFYARNCHFEQQPEGRLRRRQRTRQLDPPLHVGRLAAVHRGGAARSRR